MDKTLEIVVAAAVIIAIGSIAAYLVDSEASSFSGWIGQLTGDSKCELAQQRCDTEMFDNNQCSEEGYDEITNLESCQGEVESGEPELNIG